MRIKLIFILLTSTTLGYSQVTNFSELWRSQEYRGDRFFSQGLYESAIKSYMKEIEKNKVNARATAKIAESYKIIGDYDASRRYYDILANTGQLESARHFENYADVLLSSASSAKALEYYKMALEEDPDNKIIKDKVSGIIMNENYSRNSQYVIIKPVPFNSAASDFGMRPYKDKFCFTSSDGSELIVHHNYLRDLENLSNVFIVDYDSVMITEPSLLELDNYRLKNDGPLSVSGDLVAISRNNKRKSGRQNTLGIYFYQEDKNGNLVMVSEFPFNNSTHSVTHPVFNSTGDTLFFASDMPGGFGDMDIYYSTRVGTVWQAPINLGELINTPKNETYPFVDNGSLYFSSDGHAGLGGIDTYKVVELDGYKQISNLGYPVNTSWDDFGIYINGDHGFIASNNPSGKGSDDIYEFVLLPIPRIIEPVEFNLKLTDESNSKPIIDAQVKFIKETDTVSYISNREGTVVDSLMPGDYFVEVRKHSYEDFSFNIALEERMNIEKEVELTSSVITHIVSPDSILFKYGKYLLLDTAPTAELDAMVNTLNEYPEFILVISAHTDSRGKHEYNQWLSEKRAASAANYILSSGIDGSRVIQKGFGETMLLNNCHDGVRCSEEFHAVNRRLEFDFIRMDISEESKK